mmetsp:Transcript_4796/g.6699  ORF Transcript_4796/g.6699 Transcript_4796/m.6699 type:complete len:103 (-) Transcript_4796:882-1190(-)
MDCPQELPLAPAHWFFAFSSLWIWKVVRLVLETDVDTLLESFVPVQTMTILFQEEGNLVPILLDKFNDHPFGVRKAVCFCPKAARDSLVIMITCTSRMPFRS